MGFSLLGLVVALAVLAPNLLLLVAPPLEPLPTARVPVVLTALERVGQSLCLVTPVVFVPNQLHWWWLPAAVIALIGYYALWGRYLRGRRGPTLFEPWRRIPVPMAILPVATFLAAAGWLGNGWLAAAAVVLAAGHIPTSALIARATRPAGKG